MAVLRPATRHARPRLAARVRRAHASLTVAPVPLLGCAAQTDSYAKRNEFILWALDVKKVDVENLGKFEERDLFKDFMEDYNTGAWGRPHVAGPTHLEAARSQIRSRVAAGRCRPSACMQ